MTLSFLRARVLLSSFHEEIKDELALFFFPPSLLGKRVRIISAGRDPPPVSLSSVLGVGEEMEGIGLLSLYLPFWSWT